ncbi:MAG: GMC family oxidoreductase N-terminal domain-containing protein [Sphingomonadales bacterium]|nr:GMC family oxidoreductase N-terminal domain-containing protein [Sphingomonadales bacterium]
MQNGFDFVIVGGGSAGAALAARLSEDPNVNVALIEAGDRLLNVSKCLWPAPACSWTPRRTGCSPVIPGRAGLVSRTGECRCARQDARGSSGINYMVFVRGHPGDFDNWERLGADGWSYDDVLPCFKRMEEVSETNEAVISREVRGNAGRSAGIRSPVIPASRDFVKAAGAAGIPEGDYNGSGRHNLGGVASLVQTNTRHGKRSSTFHAYLENNAELRPNLTIITQAQVQRLALEGEGDSLIATGVEYRDDSGSIQSIGQSKEVILSAGAVGSPYFDALRHWPRRELEAAGVACRLDLPDVGKHLKDHLLARCIFLLPV